MISNYTKNLSNVDKQNYINKFKKFVKNDPYTLSYNVECLPNNVDYMRIVNYLLYSKSTTTNNEFRALKSLNSNNLYKSGWVKNIGGIHEGNYVIIFGQVLHTMALNAPALEAWVLVNLEGCIETAHCNCIAGLSESCSHVGAILFALDAINKEHQQNNQQSVTDVKAVWKIPSIKHQLQVPCHAIKWSNRPSKNAIQLDVPHSSEDEIKAFLNTLLSQGCHAAAMTSFNEFNETANKTQNEDFEVNELIHIYMSQLFKPEYVGLNLNVLFNIGKQIDFTLSQTKINLVEFSTRNQSKCQYWKKLRLGRITASIFKQVSRTKYSSELVSMSLLSKICTISDEINVPSIKYGCRHENNAVKYLFNHEKTNHTNLCINKCGLIIHDKKTYYAVSPDAIWTCDCCGRFPVEVKCPFCLKDGDVKSYLNKTDCPVVTSNGSFDMNRTHQYYWQVQLQCLVLNSEFGYFVIYSSQLKIIVKEKIDRDFLETELLKTDEYFFNVVLPELIGQYYTLKIKNN